MQHNFVDKSNFLPSQVPLSFGAAEQQGLGTFDIGVRESPVRRIPPEIWMAVFSEICNVSTYSFEVGKKKSAAFVISHVCSQWRDLAIELCTRFWSTLIIDAGSSECRGHAKGWAELTAMASDRSKGTEVSVVFMGQTVNVWGHVSLKRYVSLWFARNACRFSNCITLIVSSSPFSARRPYTHSSLVYRSFYG